MTTSVKVDAHAGWPVRVTQIDPKDGSEISDTIVPAHTEQTFYVHSGMDLRIHEIQPSEKAGCNERLDGDI